jgi:DNA uptake protein ComE-like DNA-binding protein
MSDIANDARVRVSIRGVPFPAGVSIDDGPTVTPDGIEVSGEEAEEVIASLKEHPQVSADNVQVRVVEPGTEPSSATLEEAVGEQTAADLREQVEGVGTLQDAKETPSEELQAVKGVGDKTVDKIREADAEVS